MNSSRRSPRSSRRFSLPRSPRRSLVRPVRFERTTFGFEGRRSIQLSYGRELDVSLGRRFYYVILPVAKSHPPKPLLRGVSHEIAFFAALVATWLLVRWTRSPDASRAAFVFGMSLVTLFGTSALYHRVDWGVAARGRMRRLDHAAIFVLIAGGYTPLFALVPSSRGGHTALEVIWIGAALGVLKSLLWPHAPKWVTALACVALGWAVVGQVVDRTAAVGALAVALLVVSGTVYSLGALVYALKRPDPYPTVFGYHEIFHAIVIVASGCLFAHVVLVLRAV